MKPDKNKNNDEFKVPEGYFENLEEQLMNHAALKKLLPKQEGFRVPENYLDDFKVNTTPEKDSPEKKPISLHPFRKYTFYAAAAATLLLLGTWMIKTRSNAFSFDQLEIADAEWLLHNGGIELSEGYLLENSSLPDLTSITITDTALDIQTLEEYILDEADIYELSE